MSGEPAHWTETLRALLVELQDAHEQCDERATADLQAMINFIALAPYADPTRLPPFTRYIRTGPRPEPPPLTPPRGGFLVPLGVPAPRTPPNGFRRIPRDHE